MPHRFPVPRPPVPGSPLDHAQAAFDKLSWTPHPVTVDGRTFAGLPARPLRVDELRDRLHDRRCRATTRDAVWVFLVHRARVDPGVWTIACLGCALPTLIETSRRLSHGFPPPPAPAGAGYRVTVRPRTPGAGVPATGAPAVDVPAVDVPAVGVPAAGSRATGVAPAEPSDQPNAQAARRGRDAVTAVAEAVDSALGDAPVGDVALIDVAQGDVEAAVLAGFLAELAVIDLTRGRVLGRLRSAAHDAGVVACREMTRAPTPWPQLVRSCPPPQPARHPDLVLARAVAAGAISRTEAALIGSTRLEPVSLAEVAAVRGQSYRDVRAARIRAERKLSVFLREQDTEAIDAGLSPLATTATGDSTGCGGPVATPSPSPSPATRTRRRRTRG